MKWAVQAMQIVIPMGNIGFSFFLIKSREPVFSRFLPSTHMEEMTEITRISYAAHGGPSVTSEPAIIHVPEMLYKPYPASMTSISSFAHSHSC